MRIRTCPKCGKEYNGYPALSRVDNKTEICSDCGVKEAMMDFFVKNVKSQNADKNCMVR